MKYFILIIALLFTFEMVAIPPNNTEPKETHTAYQMVNSDGTDIKHGDVIINVYEDRIDIIFKGFPIYELIIIDTDSLYTSYGNCYMDGLMWYFEFGQDSFTISNQSEELTFYLK